jgi:adenylosuccinate synthase
LPEFGQTTKRPTKLSWIEFVRMVLAMAANGIRGEPLR